MGYYLPGTTKKKFSFMIERQVDSYHAYRDVVKMCQKHDLEEDDPFYNKPYLGLLGVTGIQEWDACGAAGCWYSQKVFFEDGSVDTVYADYLTSVCGRETFQQLNDEEKGKMADEMLAIRYRIEHLHESNSSSQ